MNNAVLLILCLLPVGILLPLSWRLDGTDRRLRALSRIDAKLDLLLKQVGIEYDPYTKLPPNVIDALQAMLAGEESAVLARAPADVAPRSTLLGLAGRRKR